MSDDSSCKKQIVNIIKNYLGVLKFLPAGRVEENARVWSVEARDSCPFLSIGIHQVHA
jgi:hypothetical protein